MADIYGQLVSAQAELLSSDPAGVPTGRVYYNTTANTLKFYDAGAVAWKTLAFDPLTTRGDLIRRGASGLERFAAVTNNRVVRGNGTDVVLGQIDATGFFTTGAEVAQSAPGVVKSAGQLLGTNTNDAAAAGYVGEVITSTSTSSLAQATPTLGTYYDLSGLTVALTAGHWMIYVHGMLGADWSSPANSAGVVMLALRTSADVLVQRAAGQYIGDSTLSGFKLTEINAHSASFVASVNLSGSVTYKLSMAAENITGTPVYSNIRVRGDLATTYITAVRVR